MIDDTYTFQEIIGYGGSSKVFSATDSENNMFAIKAIRKDKGYESELEQMLVLREYFVMDHVGEHPNIIKHYLCNPEGVLCYNGNYQSICYNVMEYCPNGSFANIIRKTGPIEESVARFMFTQLASAVQHLHNKQFAHLDIKLENILLDEFFNVKLADFGSGVSLIKTNGMTANKVGTPLYMAPEIKSAEKGDCFKGLKADIYSLGVTLCLMLLGELPNLNGFSNVSTVGSNELFDDSQLDMNVSDEKESNLKWKYLSSPCKDLLLKMMNEDPNKRPSIDEILCHEWMISEYNEELQNVVYLEMKSRLDYLILISQNSNMDYHNISIQEIDERIKL